MNWWQIVLVVGYVWVAGSVTGLNLVVSYTFWEALFDGLIWPFHLINGLIKGDHR